MNTYRLLLEDLMVRLSWRFPVLIAWTALVGVSEGVSVVLLLPLLSRVGIAVVGTQSAANRFVDKSLALIGVDSTLAILAVVIVVAAVQAVLSIRLNWWTVSLSRHYQARRQFEILRAFMCAKWTFIADKKAGEITNAIITECERLGRAFTLALTLLGSLVVAIIYVVLSIAIAWQVTLSLITFALVAALAMSRLYKKSYAVGASLASLNVELQSALNEQFAAAKFIKASAGGDRTAALIKPLLRDLERANADASAWPGTVRNVLEFIGLIGLAIILVAAGAGMGVAAGNVVIVIALFGRLFPRLTTVQSQLYSLNANVHAIEAINKLQSAAEAEAERQDGANEPLWIDQPATLEVRNLQVRFGERVVLDQINLTLSIPGMLAIVGRSGAGKSTLVHALLGLVEPTVGSIRLGKCELASAPLGAWRRSIGYVPQETMLFHASIKDNLTLVNPTASESEIKVAARRANALEFIDSLPEGFETVIGDQGVKLSGGQRQRLGIARALLMNPALLIMDEAMSALDAQTEAELLRTLDELRKQMGVLLVAHRLAAARAADTICVFEEGRLVETGPWSELMARRTRLYALSKSQSLDHERSRAVL